MKLTSLCATLCVAGATLTLSGCTSIGAKYPTLSETSDPLDYLIKYVEADEAGAISPYLAMSYIGMADHRLIKDYADHTYWKRIWCGKTDLPSYLDEIMNVCTANGGNIQDDGWCVNPKTKAHLFQIQTFPYYNLCSNSAGISTVGVFPKRGTTFTDPIWQQFVVTYQEAQKREADENQRAAIVKAQAEQDAAQQRILNTKKVLKARLGQTLCRYTPYRISANHTISKGRLVKVISDSNILVEIKYSSGSTPQIKISQSPSDWYVCKAIRH